MADLAKLQRLRLLEEKLAEEQLMRARAVLGQIEALEQRLEQARRLADAGLLEEMVAGNASGAIRHGQATQQAVSSAAALSERLAVQRATVLTLSEAHTLVYQQRRRLDILLTTSRQLRRREEQRREQQRLDDSYLVARRRSDSIRRNRRTKQEAE